MERAVSSDNLVETCETLVNECKSLGRANARGVRGGHARWVSGFPVRAPCGGVGGNRLLLLTLEPVSWGLWLEVSSNLRNVNFASLAEVDRLNDPPESASQRAKQKSAGGTTAVCASKNNAPCVANPPWSPSSAHGREVWPIVGGHIISEE